MNYETTLQPDDLVIILISAENSEVAATYNMKSHSSQGNFEISSGQEGVQSYLIDKNGNVDLPMLGKVKLSNLTRLAAIQKITTLLENHIKDPIINLRVINFKISVLGEVNKPGVYNIQSERITLLEALSLSGDLTIYGKRDAILIIREKEGIKTIDKVDLTKRDFMNSSCYYLSQNDVIYIEPNRTKVNTAAIGPNISIWMSAISLVITIIALTIR
ncbi:MAG: polysaccharide biosynthesis/export family protein [Flavobacterium sp.]